MLAEKSGVVVYLLIKEKNEDVEDKMFIKDLKHRPFSFGEGKRGMRLLYLQIKPTGYDCKK